jgi:hypothetical protein
MIMVKALVGAFFLLFICTSSARAWNEPDGFAGLEWGASPAALIQKQSWQADRTPDEQEDRRKAFKAAISLGASTLYMNFIFLDDAFVAAAFSFDPLEINNIRDVFRERYGQPSIETETELMWRGDSVSIVIGDNVGAVDTKPYREYADQQRKRAIEDAAKNL